MFGLNVNFLGVIVDEYMQAWPRVVDHRGGQGVMTHIGRFFLGGGGQEVNFYDAIRKKPFLRL